MPELPEVDSYRTGLAKTMKGWKIEGGNVIWPRTSDANFENIKNQKIIGFDRKGKYLIIDLDNHHIIIHLRMTGRIDITSGDTPKYTTVEIQFENGKKMCLVDYRKFTIHKRVFPPVCKIGRRTVGLDWRETIGSK